MLRGKGRITGNGPPHGDDVDGVMPWNDEPPLTIAEDQVARLPQEAATQLLEHTNGFLLADAGQTGHSDRELQHLDLHDAGFFCFHLKPKTDGLADVGQGFIAGVALGVATR